MLSRQFVLPIAHELVIDLFAGGGGASTGIEQAIGRHVDIAVNHDPAAVSLHEANHPQTRHFVSDVFEVDPLAVTDGQAVGLLWASPDCKHFSKAKGGKPVSKKIRGLAWVVIKWAKLVKPRVICLENVEEFQTWGPLADDGRPCPDRQGSTFRRWKTQLENLGYRVEHRELRACDFGAPTIRKRLFLIARRDGMPIVWPEPTHAANPPKGSGLKPHRTAADCIDWSILAPSIFERDRPLADATLRRIAKGIMRYVVNAKRPFIAPVDPMRAAFLTEHANASTQRTFDAGEPLRTQCGEVKGGHFALVSAMLAKHYGGVVGTPIDVPAGTVTTADHHSLVSANLVHLGHGEQSASGARRWSHGVRDVADPLNTITASGATAGLVTSNLVKLRGDNVGSATSEPVHTVSAQGNHHAEVRAFLVKYYGSDQDPRLDEPLHTVTTKDRFALVTVNGEDYYIADIGMRMLQPRELYRAQGFPESYVIEHGADGRKLTKTEQVRMCGNSVCPPVAAALVRANYVEAQSIKEAA